MVFASEPELDREWMSKDKKGRETERLRKREKVKERGKEKSDRELSLYEEVFCANVHPLSSAHLKCERSIFLKNEKVRESYFDAAELRAFELFETLLSTFSLLKRFSDSLP